VRAKVFRAAKRGVDVVTSRCVVAAATRPRVPYEFGVLQRSIRMTPAIQVGSVVVGAWGSFAVLYAIFLELGTVKMPGGYPFLFPSADEHYGELPGEIRKAMGAA